MAVMRESWTDARLDDFSCRVDERFREMVERFDRLEARIDDESRYNRAQFGRIDARLDSIQRSIAFGAIALSSSVIAGFVTLAVAGH